MMWSTLRRRFWLETCIAGGAMLLALVTLARRDWIEVVFAQDPDAGSGILEWTMVAGLFAFVVGLSLMAWYEWSRARAAAHAALLMSVSPVASASQETNS